ncbi:MAG: rRNA maturation RNase YbeY [Candidatus Omnitrophota bacterium]
MAKTRTERKDRTAILTQDARLPFSKETARKYASRVLGELGSRKRSINILFLDDKGIRRLNRKFKNRRAATDVLAFETGDIAISVDTAGKNAKRFGTGISDELKLYIIHGILHLSGYDDTLSGDRKKMRKKEKELLDKI